MKTLRAWLAALRRALPGAARRRAAPPLPQNPYRRFYTAPRSFSELAPGSPGQPRPAGAPKRRRKQ